MSNKDLKKYNKGANSLLMKAEAEAPPFFLFFTHFLLRWQILKKVKKIYRFLGEGGNFEIIL
jgi:hypothetical protein